MGEKLIRDGKVAILVAPGFGAGWSTWGEPWMAWDKRLAECVEAGGDGLAHLAEEIGLNDYGLHYVSTHGAGDVKIEWLREGERFRIDEFDGHEALITAADDLWQIA